MHLHSFRVRNFRRLKDTYIDLSPDISILVGANNSGKTSAAHAAMLFVRGDKGGITVHDFSSELWPLIDSHGAGGAPDGQSLPRIWTQDPARRQLKLRVAGSAKLQGSALATKIYKRVKSSYFDKTDFALGVLADEPNAWTVPTYIADGLRWLEAVVVPDGQQVTQGGGP